MNLAEHEGLRAMLISSAGPTLLSSGRVSQLNMQSIILKEAVLRESQEISTLI